jgi:hypothetical protein
MRIGKAFTLFAMFICICAVSSCGNKIRNGAYLARSDYKTVVCTNKPLFAAAKIQKDYIADYQLVIRGNESNYFEGSTLKNTTSLKGEEVDSGIVELSGKMVENELVLKGKNITCARCVRQIKEDVILYFKPDPKTGYDATLKTKGEGQSCYTTLRFMKEEEKRDEEGMPLDDGLTEAAGKNRGAGQGDARNNDGVYRKGEIAVTAKRLFSDYAYSEKLSDEAYKSQIIHVYGTIIDIGWDDATNEPVIVLSSGKARNDSAGGVGVKCIFRKGNEDIIEKVQTGEYGQFKCIGAGRKNGSIILKDCRISTMPTN